MKFKWTNFGLVLVLMIFFSSIVSAATLSGNIYNSKLELQSNVLVKINTIPEQKILSKDGTYQFEISTGDYNLEARTADLSVSEKVEISSDGGYRLDLFLMPDLSEEEDLWNEVSEEELVEDVFASNTNYWSWIVGIAGLAFIVLGVWLWWKNKHKTAKKQEVPTEVVPLEKLPSLSAQEHKQELANEPSYLDDTIEIIKKHGGRIYQKELRKEMMHLSESKISLILTELEHNGRIEKIKKGRGNAIILK